MKLACFFVNSSIFRISCSNTRKNISWEVSVTDLVTGMPASLVGRGMLNEVPDYN